MSQKIKTTVIEKETDMQQSITGDAVKVAVMNTELQHVNETMKRIESKFDEAIKNFATNDKLEAAIASADAKHAEQDKAIKKLEDWNTWAVRIVLAAVILAGMSLILINK